MAGPVRARGSQLRKTQLTRAELPAPRVLDLLETYAEDHHVPVNREEIERHIGGAQNFAQMIERVRKLPDPNHAEMVIAILHAATERGSANRKALSSQDVLDHFKDYANQHPVPVGCAEIKRLSKGAETFPEMVQAIRASAATPAHKEMVIAWLHAATTKGTRGENDYLV